jgi:hypothetical protein
MPSFTGHKTETFAVANSLATNVAALTALSGVDISNGYGFSMVLAAESTRTLTSGALRCYLYSVVTCSNYGSPATYAWVPYNDGDETTVSSTVANRYKTWNDRQPLVGVGRVVYLPDTIVVSAGTTVSITYSIRRSRS